VTKPIFIACTAIFFVAGCTHQQQIDDRANRQILANHAESEREVIKLQCADGADLGPSCGLLLSHAATPEFRDRYREKKCADKTTEQCQVLYQRDVDIALADRYWAADFRSVAKRCDAEAPRCEDPLAYERDLLGSHNTRVLIEASNKQMAIESNRDHAQAADRAHAAAVAGEVAFALHDGPKCRTYPNVLGGWNTVCSR
jgi:hypothetical protein